LKKFIFDLFLLYVRKVANPCGITLCCEVNACELELYGLQLSPHSRIRDKY